jgi:hypothetical protein
VGLYELGAFPEKSVPRDAGSRRRYTACLLVHDAPCLILPGRLPIVALPRKRGLALEGSGYFGSSNSRSARVSSIFIAAI